MPCGTEEITAQHRDTSGQQQVTHLGQRADMEWRGLNTLEQLGNNQAGAMHGLLANLYGNMNYQQPDITLNANNQALLDQQYQGAIDRLGIEGKDYADFLAGGRGMRMSDTPVAQQAIQRYGLGLSDLLGQKAGAALNLGQNLYQMGQQNRQFNIGSLLAGTQVMPSALGFTMQNNQNERALGAGKEMTGYNQMSLGSSLNQDSNTFKNVAQGVFGGVSDARLKRDITPVKWHWKTGGNEQFGVVAQDVQKSHPHLVSRTQDGDLMVDYGLMVAMLLDEREALYAQLGQ